MKNYILDAERQSVGRLAAKIAHILQGKSSSQYDPKDLVQMSITVKNISKLSFTGKKLKQKTYYRHAGKLGHLKEKTLSDVFAKNPARVLELAVKRMLPKNRLQAKRMRMLRIER